VDTSSFIHSKIEIQFICKNAKTHKRPSHRLVPQGSWTNPHIYDLGIQWQNIREGFTYYVKLRI